MSSPAERYTGPGAGAIHLLLKVMNAIIIFSGCIMASTFFCVVILRYGFGTDLFAYEEWLLAIGLLAIFFSQCGRHLSRHPYQCRYPRHLSFQA